MKKRVINKTIAKTLVVILSVGTMGISSIADIYAQENINVFSTDNLNKMENEATDNINENYLNIIGNEKYSCIVPYKEEVILFGKGGEINSNNIQKTNCEKQIFMTADTTITFVNNKGIENILTNKNEDGTAKYDSLYIFKDEKNVPYNYITVQKGDKVGLIDKYGNEITLGGLQWYDDIQQYHRNGENLSYGLFTNKADGLFDFTLVSESGQILFSIKNCNNIEKISTLTDKDKIAISSTNYILFTTIDGTSELIDLTGKVWYSGKAYSSYQIIKGATAVILQFNGTYKYYNIQANDIVEGIGEVSYDDYVYVYSNGSIKCFDNNMSELFSVTGYSNIKYLAGCFILETSDGRKNYCDKYGELLFEEPQDIDNITEVNYYDHISVSIKNQTPVLFYYGEKFDKDKVKAVCDNVCYSLGLTKDDIISSKYYDIGNAGYVFKYEAVENQNYYAIATKESNYTKAKVIKADNLKEMTYMAGSMGKNYNILYSYEKVDKNITLKDGTVKQCKYKLLSIFDYNHETLYEVNYDMDLYMEDLVDVYDYNSTIVYSDNGQGYNIKPYTEELLKNNNYNFGNFGDTGYYYVYHKVEQSNRYTIYNSKGEDIGIELNKLYNNENVSIRYVTEFADKGFLKVEYTNDLTGKIESALYSYKGEEILTKLGSEDYYQANDIVITILSDGTAVLINPFGKEDKNETISNIISNTDLKIDGISNIDVDTLVITGIETNTTVDTIKQKLASENIQICDKDGNIVDTSSPVGTGSQIQLLKDGQVIDTAVVVVKGDTDGTGTINILDMEAMQKSILGINKLTGVYKTAALLNDNEQNISVLDMETVQKDILGIKKITQ